MASVAGLGASARRIDAPRLATTPWRLDEALHGLVQLPDELRLELSGEEAELRRLRLLAWAYGIEERVELHRSGKRAAVWLHGAERIPHDPAAGLAETIERLWPPDAGPRLGRGDDTILAGHRIAIVSHLPVRYRLPLFAGIARRLEAVQASLRVFFLRSSAGERSWLAADDALDFDHEVLSGFDLPIRDRPPRVPLRLEAALRRHRPTIALSAGLSPLVSARVLRHARRVGIPFGLWSGDTSSTARSYGRLRCRQRRALAQGTDFGIAYGALAAVYIGQLAPELPVVNARNSSVTTVDDRRSRLARPDTIELLAVGDLASQRKGVDVAMRALPNAPCRLTVIGDGRLRGDLERQAGGDARVRFLGPLRGSRLGEAYARSDVFLFPSRREVFGLALAEAMSHGLASIVSSVVGAVGDLAAPERNCLVVDGHDPETWRAAMVRLIADHELRSELGEAARRTIARRWTVDHSVEGYLAGLRLGARAAAE